MYILSSLKKFINHVKQDVNKILRSWNLCTESRNQQIVKNIENCYDMTLDTYNEHVSGGGDQFMAGI